MTTTKKNCPVCGSMHITTRYVMEKISYYENAPITLNLVENRCPACASTGDFFDKNAEIVEEALNVLRKQDSAFILKYLEKKGIGFAGMELDLDLPQGTLKQWQKDPENISPEGRALLRAVEKDLVGWVLKFV